MVSSTVSCPVRLSANGAGADPLIENRSAIGQWEEFDLIYD
jgi:hypothetical protein